MVGDLVRLALYSEHPCKAGVKDARTPGRDNASLLLFRLSGVSSGDSIKCGESWNGYMDYVCIVQAAAGFDSE